METKKIESAANGALKDSFGKPATELVNVASLRIEEKKTLKNRQQDFKRALKVTRTLLKEPFLFLQPNSDLLQKWNLIVVLVAVVAALFTPFEVAFYPLKHQTQYLGVNCTIDVVFWIDFVATFFTGFRDNENNIVVKSYKKIAAKYLRGFLLFDLLASLPYEFFLLDSAIESLKFLRLLRLLKLLKIPNLIRDSIIYRNFLTRVPLSSSILTMIEQISIFFWFCHLFSCIFIATAQIETIIFREENIMFPTWIQMLNVNKFLEDDDPHSYMSWSYLCSKECEELHRVDITEVSACQESCSPLSNWKIYEGAMYWSIVSITSVGYGDLSPNNTTEMLFTAFYLLMASFFWASIIGNVTAIICTRDPVKIDYAQTMDALNDYMSRKNMPPKLRRRLRQYFSYSKDLARNSLPSDLLNKLSPLLKYEIIGHNGTWVTKLRMFEELPPGQEVSRDFTVNICERLTGSLHAPEESIPWRDKLFVLGSGSASHRGKIKLQGSSWGEDFILADYELKIKCEGYALTFAEVLQLERNEFYSILHSFDKEKTMVRKFLVRMAGARGIFREAKKRRRLADAIKKHITKSRSAQPSLSDLETQERKLEQENRTAIIEAQCYDDTMQGLIAAQGRKLELLAGQLDIAIRRLEEKKQRSVNNEMKQEERVSVGNKNVFIRGISDSSRSRSCIDGVFDRR